MYCMQMFVYMENIVFEPFSCPSKHKVVLDLDFPTVCPSLLPLVSQVLPTSSSSQMITFTFSNGGVATMRTSGTEPKIKYYTELCAAPGNRWVFVAARTASEKWL